MSDTGLTFGVADLPEEQQDRIRAIVLLMLPDIAGEFSLTPWEVQCGEPRRCHRIATARRLLYWILRDNLKLAHREIAAIVKPIIPSASRSNVANASHFLKDRFMEDDELEQQWDSLQASFTANTRIVDQHTAAA